MASYLRSWLTTGTTATPRHDDGKQGDSSSDDDTVTADDYDDTPPSFPAKSSAQRVSSDPLQLPRIINDSTLMPPPQPPNRHLGSFGTRMFNDPAGSLTVPSTSSRPDQSLGVKKREKVALAPGFGPLDWAALKSSGQNLRGVDTLLRIPPSELKRHNKRSDAWAAFNGKVYNITRYLSYHPGGASQLMRAAGRDGTKLFMSTHAWVNVDFMLDSCLVGFLVPEPSYK